MHYNEFNFISLKSVQFLNLYPEFFHLKSILLKIFLNFLTGKIQRKSILFILFVF